MRIITKSPDLNDYEASASVDLGLTGSHSVRQRYNAMVNVPIMTDEMGLRVTGYYRNEDGWVDNIGTGIKDSNSMEAFGGRRSEEHTSELQSLMRISYAVFCLIKKKKNQHHTT